MSLPLKRLEQEHLSLKAQEEGYRRLVERSTVAKRREAIDRSSRERSRTAMKMTEAHEKRAAEMPPVASRVDATVAALLRVAVTD